MNIKPWLTSDDLVKYIELTMMFPRDQSTMTYNDILSLANQEMQVSTVPSMMELYQEYFSFKTIVPLVTNISKYAIPNRAIGMVLRDLKYSDANGNFNDMTRISPEDKAYFQNNTGVNQVIAKYYLEGNNVVLTPQTNTNPTGNLNFWFFLRPNFLVRNDRACTILNFQKDITISDYTGISPGDIIQIVTNTQSVSPTIYTFMAVNNSAQAIASVSADGTNDAIITTTFPHNIPTGINFQVIISGSGGSTPDINGVWQASSTGTDSFTIPVVTTVGGSGGVYTIVNQFIVETDNDTTATNLDSAINTAGLTSTVATNIVTMIYDDIATSFTVAQAITNDTLPGILDIDVDNIFINFNQLPLTYIEPDTQEVSTLYSNGCLVDFLQTLPGHRTYNFDVTLKDIEGTVGKFAVSQLQTFNTNGSGGPETYYPILVGDYIALQNECIIPQVPPELHSALAERTSSRILMALGDRDGYAVSQQKISQMNASQDIMIGDRTEGSTPKVFNRYSMLRMGKRVIRRRFV